MISKRKSNNKQNSTRKNRAGNARSGQWPPILSGVRMRANQAYGMLGNLTGLPAMLLPNKDNTVVNFSQIYNVGTILSSSGGPTFYSYAFNINSLDQLSALTSLFDQYRIIMVEVVTIPHTSATTSSSGNPGQLISVVDYDDANSFSSVAQAYDYENAIIGNGTSQHYRRFQPHAAYALYAPSTFTSFGNIASPWCDAASPSVAHYGVKFAWTTTDSQYSQDVEVRLHTQWRNTR